MVQIGFLPTEIILIIFSFLNEKDLLICAKIDKFWNAVSNDDTLWKSRYNKLSDIMYHSVDDVNHLISKIPNKTCIYKNLYMSFTKNLIDQTISLFPIDWKLSDKHYFNDALRIIKNGVGTSMDINKNIQGIRRGNPKIKYTDAIKCGYVEMVAYYISLGIDPSLSDLTKSITKGNIEMVKLLLRFDNYQLDNAKISVFALNKSSTLEIRSAVSESPCSTKEMFQLIEPYGGNYTHNDLKNQFAAGNLAGIKYIIEKGVNPTVKTLINAIKLSYRWTNGCYYMRANAHIEYQEIATKLTPELFEYGISQCKYEIKQKNTLIDAIMACEKINHSCFQQFIYICYKYGYNTDINNVISFMKNHDCLDESNLNKLNIVFDFMIRELKVIPVLIRKHIIDSISNVGNSLRSIPVQNYLDIFAVLR